MTEASCAWHRASLEGARVLVLGLGRFGGGVETARFLRGEGAHCLISDSASREALAESAEQAEAQGASLTFGPQTPALLAGIDAVIANPAMPFDHPVLRSATEQGLPVTTEINMVLARAPCPVLGVTGTKGKSTTTTLLTAMLRAAGRTVHLGGNIGAPLVGALDTIAPSDLIVLELSSFQLWWTGSLGISPHLALLTNLFPDHLDRHITMEAYTAAKRAMFEAQGPGDVAILPRDDTGVVTYGFETAGGARRVWFGNGTSRQVDEGPSPALDLGGTRIPLGDIPLLGRHNRRNVLAAATAAQCVEAVTPAAIRAGALATEPLPHRLRTIATVGGVRFVDDSNGTNPTSTRCALDAMDAPTVLLLGGKDKGLDMAPLLEHVATHAKAVVAMGATGSRLMEALTGRLPVRLAASMSEAVHTAYALCQEGDVVLLSPAHSSFDQYASFVARGRAFAEAADTLT